MQAGSSKCKLVPVTGKLPQLLAMLFKTPMSLERQLESSLPTEVHLFSPSLVSWLIITNFIPLTAHLWGKVTNATPMWEGNTQTQLKQHKERFCGAENGTRVHLHVLPHTAGSNNKTREENYAFFSRLCQTKRDFRKDNTWEIKVSQPTPISYHEALVDLPKVVHFSRKLLYLSLGHVTQDAVSLFCLPILFPPFTSLLPPPADPVGSLSANPKTFQSLCHPGATRPPLAVSHHWVASKPYLLLPCIIKL